MRATIGQLRDHPSWIGDWGAELPARHGWWWREVLRDPGTGWLRWKFETRWYGGSSEPPEPSVVAPPLRRLALRLRGVSVLLHGRGVASWWHEWDVMVDEDRKRLWR